MIVHDAVAFGDAFICLSPFQLPGRAGVGNDGSGLPGTMERGCVCILWRCGTSVFSNFKMSLKVWGWGWGSFLLI